MPWTSTFSGACVVRPLRRGSGPPSCPVLGGQVAQRAWLFSRPGAGFAAGCAGAAGKAVGVPAMAAVTPWLKPGPQAEEGVCASEVSVVLQFHVHKLT